MAKITRTKTRLLQVGDLFSYHMDTEPPRYELVEHRTNAIIVKVLRDIENLKKGELIPVKTHSFEEVFKHTLTRKEVQNG